MERYFCLQRYRGLRLLAALLKLRYSPLHFLTSGVERSYRLLLDQRLILLAEALEFIDIP